MRTFISILLFTCSIFASNAQTTTEEVAGKVQQATDSLTIEQKVLAISLAEQIMLSAVDSVMNEGMYMQALEMLDSIQVNWKKITDMEPSARMYLMKGQILMSLEEWEELVQTTTECISVHKDDIQDKVAAIIFSMQGSAYRNLENYKSAIRSYEYGLSYYNKSGDLGSQGDMMCSMANCYVQIGKTSMASSFYEKGFAKFLDYFGTTRSALLKGKFYVQDTYMKSVLGVFSSHLMGMAVHEQNCGDRVASKEFLRMSANCGNSHAQSEYERIYGY